MLSPDFLIADSTGATVWTDSDGISVGIYTTSAIFFLKMNFIEKFCLFLRHTKGYGLFKCSSEFVTWLGWAGTLKNDFEMWTMSGAIFPYHFDAQIDQVLNCVPFVGVRIDVRIDVQIDDNLGLV
jgi:hypothetical protein